MLRVDGPSSRPFCSDGTLAPDRETVGLYADLEVFDTETRHLKTNGVGIVRLCDVEMKRV
jgi:hypothetical protein